VSKAYGVVATPDVFLITPEKRVVYRLNMFKQGSEAELEGMIEAYLAGTGFTPAEHKSQTAPKPSP
jgi:hypothetical protein